MTRRLVWSERARSYIEAGASTFTARSSLETRTVHTLGELLQSLERERVELVVLDLESPQLPAGAACERVRAEPRTAAVPIVVLAPAGADPEIIQALDCNQVIPAHLAPQAIQEKLAATLGMRLRRHPRFPVVLPVARGRIFHEFLGYSHEISESGMGFETIVRIRGGEQLNLKIYRSTDEKPISATGRVCGVRPNIDTGIGYAVGVEFVRLGTGDKRRLVELFPADPCVTWGSEGPPDSPKPDSEARFA